MDKSAQNPAPETDLTNEPYKGASPTVAAAGEGYIAHFIFAIVGLIGGGALAYAFHKPVNHVMNGWKSSAARMVESSNGVAKFVGGFSQWLVGHPQGTFSKTVKDVERGIGNAHMRQEVKELVEGKEGGFIHRVAHTLLSRSEKLRSNLHSKSAERANAAVMGGGLLGAAGFILSPIIMAPSGALKAIRGKRQHGQMRDKIDALSAENERLRESLAKQAESSETTAPSPSETPPMTATKPAVSSKLADESDAPASTIATDGTHADGRIAAASAERANATLH